MQLEEYVKNEMKPVFDKMDGSVAKRQDKQSQQYGHRDGNDNVDTIIRCFLEAIYA